MGAPSLDNEFMQTATLYDSTRPFKKAIDVIRYT